MQAEIMSCSGSVKTVSPMQLKLELNHCNTHGVTVTCTDIAEVARMLLLVEQGNGQPW